MLPPGVLTPRRLKQLWYAPILALAMGLMMVRLLVMARLLDLAGFAQFSAALLVSTSFCMLACLGLQSMLQRELPVLIVRGRERRGSLMTAQCVIVAVACAVAGVAFAAAFGGVAGLSLAGTSAGLIHGLSQQLFLVALIDSRSRGDPVRASVQSLLRSVAVLLAGGLAALTGSALGVIVAEAVVSIALCAPILTAQAQARAGALHGAVLWEVARRRLLRVDWRACAILLGVASLGFVQANADRWVAAESMARTDFAHYAFAWIVLMVAQSVQVVINASLFPVMARRFAAGGHATALNIAARATWGLLAVGLLLVVPLWWLFNEAIERWFPAYAEARAALVPLLLAAAIRLSDFWSSFAVIVGQESRLLWLQLSFGLGGAGVWWAMTRWIEPSSAVGQVAWLAMALSVAAWAAAGWATVQACRRARGAAA